MDEQQVRERAEAVCDAIVDGDIERMTEDLSAELMPKLGEVLALLPLPATEATVESVERSGASGFAAVLRLVGETEEVRIQTRWKDRAGSPTIVEVSHLSREEAASPGDAESGDLDAAEDQPA